ncbi:MAG: hypothetical protein ACTSPK_01050 [Candidatus Heimdallarchaeota archaeon]
MLKSIKLNKNYFLYGVLSVNIILFISFITYILFLYNLLPNNLAILVYPFFLLSNNTFVVVITLAIESLLIGLYYTKSRKPKPESIEEENIKFKIEHSNNESIENGLIDQRNEQELVHSIVDSGFNEESQDVEIPSVIDFHTISNDLVNNIENDEVIVPDKDDFDLSPQFLETNDELIRDELDFNTDHESEQVLQKIQKETQKFDNVLNDFQFAFYKNIIENDWLYEKASDRERIGFDKYAIDESKISLADLEVLQNSKAIYREQIHHPTGQFYVYSAIKNIEKSIIFESIRRITRKKRLKFTKRKISFPNWKEFGLAKQTWQFDFEVPQLNIIGCIWSKDSFLTIDKKSGEKKLLSDKKNELKTLIAAVTLKLKEEGKALIITSVKEEANFIKRLVKATGWGDVKVLYFSNHSFFNEFEKLLKHND